MTDHLMRYDMKTTKVMIVEAVVDQEYVLEWWTKTTGLIPSDEWKIAAHHMTIKFFEKNEKNELKAMGISQAQLLKPYVSIMNHHFELNIIGYAHDEKGMAILVSPTGLLAEHMNKPNPHVTIATKGIGAKYSNELLANGNIIPASGSLQAKVGWMDSTGQDHFILPHDFIE